LLLFVGIGGAFLAYREYGSAFSPEEAQQSQPTELSQPESSSTTPSTQSTDEGWATTIAQDASPSLATQGETMGFGHRIALTFDDGPDPTTTPAILDILRTYNLKATFFVVGARAEQHPELIKRIVNEGHTLGNHTYYHMDLTKVNPGQVLEELQDWQAVIDQALGRHFQVTLFRPPCAASYDANPAKLPALQEALREQKMYRVMWTIDSNDWALKDQPESIVANLAQNTPESGGVILFHDTQAQTVQALSKILDNYEQDGYKFTTVRGLLAEKYGVDPNSIEDGPENSQPAGALPPLTPSGNNVPENLSSLAECLTYSGSTS
jgi:peptidoglycan/xylan/chitin deacetylase (PgdA/CDA1 family)